MPETIHRKFGICNGCTPIVFRCNKCNFAINTCGDCISDESKLTDEFMQHHFVNRSMKKTPFIRAGECFNCHLQGDKKRIFGNMIHAPDEKERALIGRMVKVPGGGKEHMFKDSKGKFLGPSGREKPKPVVET